MPDSALSLHVHLLPHLVEPATIRDGVVVVIDVLRATTTIAAALHAGITSIYPVGEIPLAMSLAEEFSNRGESVLLGGERGGIAIPGFDFDNSPCAYDWNKCQGKKLILTTTNGTGALLRVSQAARITTAAFVNFSAVCETILQESRPIHFVCAGTHGDITLEDTMLAGAFIAALVPHKPVVMNDCARLAWDTFECHGLLLEEALRLSAGGKVVEKAGCQADIQFAAQVDRIMLVPQARRDERQRMFLEVGSIGLERKLWPGK
jgi:2-phosphosulfolactate phosphatase